MLLLPLLLRCLDILTAMDVCNLTDGSCKRWGLTDSPGRGAAPWLFGGSARGLGGGGRRRRPAPVQVIHVGHDQLAPLLGHAVQHQVPLVVLQDLLHVLQVLI